MEQVQTIVIGAGVVGLAIARALALTGREVVILEAEEQIGSITSARNSEVIHAGIYYAPDSLKARLCVEGRHALYRYCASRHVPHRRSGKLIAAVDLAEADALDGIAKRAVANGVSDLRLIDGGEAKAMEPALNAVAALHSPSTGIVDSHALMLSLLGEAEGAGAMLALGTPVASLSAMDGGFRVQAGGETPMELIAREVINAAGHGAAPLSRPIADDVPQTWLAKGNYFTLSRKAPFSHLIYPVPSPGGLGTHLTLDMAGQARFGPDVEWLEDTDHKRADYSVDPDRAERFYSDIRRYWPGLEDGELEPGYAGIRPKICPPGAPAADFRIETHGLEGFVALYGIESPGLTSCLAIAEEVGKRLRAR
ncbi:MAG: NAD(P)/FAD-dependent oxidoreductase [Pseudomonadota bacterium]